MSIHILYELQHEVRRLMIAGSGLAAGDVRLTRMLPQLQKLGETTPVFQRMAQAVSQVVEAEASGSASALLELGTLLQSVLYTQGRTETKEELASMEGTEAELGTTVTYRKLAPVLEALTTKGQGRMEQLSLGYENGYFQDLRVIPAAVAALDDSYAEIPEYLQRKVLPAFGTEALPALYAQLDLNGGRGDARRLELTHQLLPSSDNELLLKAAQEGSTEIRAAATELLGEDPKQEDFILELADDKRKEVRKAALHALSRLGTKQAAARLYKALTSKERDLAIEPIRRCMAPELTLAVIEHADQALERIVQRSKVEDAAAQLLTCIQCLEGKRISEAAHFLQKLLSTPEFIVPETERVQDAAAELLIQLDLPEADQFALTLQEAYGGRFIAASFKAAIRTLTPEELFDRYSPVVRTKRKASAQELIRVLHHVRRPLDEWERRYYSAPPEQEYAPWDERWVHLFVQLDEAELVCRFVSRPDPEVAQYLMKKCEAGKNFNNSSTVNMLLVLFGMRVPEASKLLMFVLEQGKNRHLYYLDRTQLTVLSLLDRRYADKLTKFAEGMAYESVKTQLLEIAEAIAQKPERIEESEEEKGQGLWAWIRSKM
jgi:hypothetical protein